MSTTSSVATNEADFAQLHASLNKTLGGSDVDSVQVFRDFLQPGADSICYRLKAHDEECLCGPESARLLKWNIGEHWKDLNESSRANVWLYVDRMVERREDELETMNNAAEEEEEEVGRKPNQQQGKVAFSIPPPPGSTPAASSQQLSEAELEAQGEEAWTQYVQQAEAYRVLLASTDHADKKLQKFVGRQAYSEDVKRGLVTLKLIVSRLSPLTATFAGIKAKDLTAAANTVKRLGVTYIRSEKGAKTIAKLNEKSEMPVDALIHMMCERFAEV